jgi:hypothetical protein
VKSAQEDAESRKRQRYLQTVQDAVRAMPVGAVRTLTLSPQEADGMEPYFASHHVRVVERVDAASSRRHLQRVTLTVAKDGLNEACADAAAEGCGTMRDATTDLGTRWGASPAHATPCP